MTKRKRRNHSPSFKAEEKVQELHAKIGELTMERDFLSKALGGIR